MLNVEYIVHLQSFVVEADSPELAKIRAIEMLRNGDQEPYIDFVEED